MNLNCKPIKLATGKNMSLVEFQVYLAPGIHRFEEFIVRKCVNKLINCAAKTIDDKLVIHQITTNRAITTDKVIVNNNNGLPDDEGKLFERMLADKDQEIAFLRSLLGNNLTQPIEPAATQTNRNANRYIFCIYFKFSSFALNFSKDLA